MKTHEDHPFVKIAPEGATGGTRALATEVPISLTFNGVSHVVMMATPTDLEDFALGFALAERIIDAPDELLSVKATEIEGGILLKADIPPARHRHLLESRRNMVGQTGCGICGVVELEHALAAPAAITARPTANREALFRAVNILRDHQDLNLTTGAVHAAALCDEAGDVLAMREDVGRHNAFDKLVGHIHRAGLPPDEGFVVLTSRCSHELVQKAAILGTPMLVTISAPTTLAIDLAKRAGLTLIALARSDSLLCFNDPNGLFGTAL